MQSHRLIERKTRRALQFVVVAAAAGAAAAAPAPAAAAAIYIYKSRYLKISSKLQPAIAGKDLNFGNFCD